MDRDYAQAIAEKYFSIQATAAELPSERDRNFLLVGADGEKFVLKVANAREERAVLEAQNAMLEHLQRRVSFCPRVVAASSRDLIVSVKFPGGETHMIRLVRYLPGVPLAVIDSPSVELLRDLGRKLGQLTRALADFDHPAAHREFYWDLAQGAFSVREQSSEIKDESLRKLVSSWNTDVKVFERLRKSVIHGDANDYNVLVERERVVGLIDFGDIVYSYTVGDLAIAIAYVVLGKADPYAAAAPVIDGYRDEFVLTEHELDALWPLVRLRLCMSVCIAAHQQAREPENEYLGISQRLIAETLPRLMNR